jgi:hypothetical protein
MSIDFSTQPFLPSKPQVEMELSAQKKEKEGKNGIQTASIPVILRSSAAEKQQTSTQIPLSWFTHFSSLLRCPFIALRFFP